MKAWHVTHYGLPNEVLKLVETNDFEPEPGHVKVKVEAAGLGLPGVFMCTDTYPFKPPLPFVPSQEAVGSIVAVGERVNPVLIGTRGLGLTSFQSQRGGLAEYCQMQEGSSFTAPENMSAEEAAAFIIPYLTAWVGLAHRAKIKAGETVLVLGASGSSGYAAIQLAKAKRSKVIAVAGGAEKSAFCESLGAIPNDTNLYQAAYQDLIQHWQNGELKTTSIQAFPFDQGSEAIQHIASKKVEGKVVVTL